MIPIVQHRKAVTQAIIGRFSDSASPKLGLSAWFPTVTTATKEVSIEVQRGRGLIAVDVERGTAGNLNTFSKSTEKIYIPPFFKEKFNFSDLDIYQRTYGNNTVPSKNDVIGMRDRAGEKLMTLKDKIDRAKELQRAQALQTGIVTMKNGDNIDFKRKADSISDLGAGNYWNEGTSKPLSALAEGIRFVKLDGKSTSSYFDLLMGRSAVGALLANEQIKEYSDFRHMKRLEIGTSKFDDTTGLIYHGRLSLENGIVELWSYDDTYEKNDGTHVEYVDPKNTVLLPRDFVGKHAHAGIPAIIRDTSNAEFSEYIRQMQADYWVNNYVDPIATAHFFDLMSAPLAVPFSIDRMWTAKVLA